MRTLLSLALAASFCSAISQGTPPPAGQGTPPPKTDAPKQDTPAKPKSDLKEYKDVITKDFATQEGMFKVHRSEEKEKILWEIPENMVGRDFLWQTEVSELSGGGGYPGLGAGTRVIHFERRKNKLFMRDSKFDLRTNDTGALATGVKATTVNPIIRSFDIQTESDGKGVVIDVTSLFTSDPAEFQVKMIFGGGGVDPGRSYIQRTKAFPTNIETRSVLTFIGGAPRPGGGGTNTVTIHYSLVALPEKPMVGRYKDSRIGYFTSGYEFIPDNRPVKALEYVNRYRLEKKDPNAALSEPVKPIVYYLAREVPDRWRPYLKRGVEKWQEAFAAAGFKNAIICRDAPTLKEDPDWDPEDARYSVIRWAPSSTANAMGPSIQDPRSGETISAHVIFWHNIIDILQKWTFVQTAATDPEAARIPMSDDMIGRMIEYVCTHEVGHTLGLEHNFEASSTRTIAQLRNKEYMKTHGVSSSVMSYSRSNYVTQPGDGITYSNNRFLGEYDLFAIQYGYKPIPGAFNADDEKPWLDTFLARQVTDPTVRFANYKFSMDPTSQSERIGDDTIEATRLGLLNLSRIGQGILIPATSRFGDDYTQLGEFYGELQQHRIMWLMHVMREVGGVVENDVHAGRGNVFMPVPREKQLRAVKFLVNTGMEMPSGMLNPEILRKIYPGGDLGRITMVQNLIMSQLLAESRVQRLLDQKQAMGAGALGVDEMVGAVTSGVWRELATPTPTVSTARRMVQQSYLTTMETRLTGEFRSKSDFAFIAKSNLKSVAKQIDAALPKTKDKMTAAHLMESRAWINRIMAEKPSGAAANPMASIYDLFGVTEQWYEMHKDHAEHGLCFSGKSGLIEMIRRLEK